MLSYFTPETKAGKWALKLSIAAIALPAIGLLLGVWLDALSGGTGFGPLVPISFGFMLGGLSVFGACIASLIALFLQKERAPFVILIAILGGLALAYGIWLFFMSS